MRHIFLSITIALDVCTTHFGFVLFLIAILFLFIIRSL